MPTRQREQPTATNNDTSSRHPREQSVPSHPCRHPHDFALQAAGRPRTRVLLTARLAVQPIARFITAVHTAATHAWTMSSGQGEDHLGRCLRDAVRPMTHT
ncbi:hypothetical protein JDV02_006862 [Purpureocillium takamizusanense]|uniref:Uncharacterized protein n=1 Tax=Purpureocillium takamizusanense TaxID=2060973 RepID=A0A9Q8VDE4_9HYPO|nr:uncharacterized protein JDV02_006862 [Purpureocillium takamizusanense]UNI20809.1 hypothetical protein JDV02_006862 [Purpureocillium takamizusanense]